MTWFTKIKMQIYIKTTMVVAIVGMLKGAKNNGDELLNDGNQHGENVIRWRETMVYLRFKVSRYDYDGAK